MNQRQSFAGIAIVLLTLALAGCSQETSAPEPIPEPTTTLSDAIEANNVEEVRRHIAHGTPLDKINECGDEPLVQAITANHDEKMRPEIFFMLLDAGADPDVSLFEGSWSVLHIAVNKDHIKAVKALIEKGANLLVINDVGLTPLHYARSPEVVRALIDAGAFVETKGRCDETPLHFAATCGRSEAVKALVGANADTHAKDNNGSTPLHKAARDARLDVIKLLLDAGADIEAKDRWGTPLHHAASGGEAEAIKTLLKAGANINSQTTWGTPLHCAASWCRVEAVETLLGAGAKVNAINEDGQTSLDIVGQSSKLADVATREKVRSLLRSYGGKKGTETKGE